MKKLNLRNVLLCSAFTVFLSYGIPYIAHAQQIEVQLVHGNHAHRHGSHRHNHQHRHHGHRHDRQRVYRGGAYVYVQPPVVHVPSQRPVRCINERVRRCNPYYTYQRRCY